HRSSRALSTGWTPTTPTSMPTASGRSARDEAARDPVRNVARELLFYWQVRRWTMDGSLRARYPELLALPGPGLAPPLAPEDVGPRRPA
ncbi:MAG TPA: hypothetical protein VMN37_08300, partial [Gemmatimonadales bacterium]|nr:hypothetical protein [Gemmatimonadales bacterium]